MTTTHTPGPWVFGIEIDGDTELDIYSAEPGEGGYLRSWVATAAIDNAHLIAAAPQLLEVCEAISARYNHDDRLGGLGDWLTDVIALATGVARHNEPDEPSEEERIGTQEMFRRQEGRGEL